MNMRMNLVSFFWLYFFLIVFQIYNEDDIIKAKLTVLEGTSMVDFAVDIYKNMNETDEVPPGMLFFIF